MALWRHLSTATTVTSADENAMHGPNAEQLYSERLSAQYAVDTFPQVAERTFLVIG